MRYIHIGSSYPTADSSDTTSSLLRHPRIPWFVQAALQYLLVTLRRFDDASVAEAWLTSQRWPEGVRCPDCGGANIAEPASRSPVPYRCRLCLAQFSIKSYCAMRGSKLPLAVWAQGIHLSSAIVNPVGLDTRAILTISPRAAWNLAWRIREAWDIEHKADLREEGLTVLAGRARGLKDGRLVLPPRIPTAPENIARSLFRLPAHHLWLYDRQDQDEMPRPGGSSQSASGRELEIL